jgi:hypothetical protein
MNNFEFKTKGHDEWLTPKFITDGLGPFDLDPCSPVKRPWDTAKSHFNKLDNGLLKEWKGFVWLNPPYGRECKSWLNKMKLHNNGIALVFARTETDSFFKNVWEAADAILFLKGRISFCYVDGVAANPAGAGSCLIAYGNLAVIRLRTALDSKLIKGHIIYTK